VKRDPEGGQNNLYADGSTGLGTALLEHELGHLLSGQVCKFVGDQAAVGWALSRVWVCCRSSLSRRSARSLVVNFHLKGVAASL
jgi:hypothetical protein